MAIRVSSWLSRPLALRSLVHQARLAVRLLREPCVPVVLKAIPAIGALYVVAPIDVVPDFFPGLGQLDDIGVVVASLELFVRLCPQNAQSFHRDAIAQHRRYSPMPSRDHVIEAEWRKG